jgi:hypothetical protein
MSIVNAVPLLEAAGGGDYTISRSVRLRSSASAYFNRTPASSGNRQVMTFSFWMKRGLLTYSANYINLFTAYPGTSAIDMIAFSPSSDSFRVWFNGGISADLITTQVFRDPSAWYHVVVAIDTTQATSSNRIKVYVNGSQITSFSTSTYPTQNYSTYWNSSSYASAIGANLNGPQGYFDGYLTEVNFIDGQALTPSSFGSTNAITGVWQPAKYTGTYGTNGFYLPFSLNANSTYAGAFNGSSQYLTTATNASLALGTNNFTVEYWIYISSAGGGVTAVSSGNGTTTYDGLFGYQTGSQSLVLYLSSAGSSWDIASGVTIGSTPTGTWNHVAVTRNGNTFYTFVNGIQGATFTSSASIYQSANSFVLGRAQSGTPLNGNLSNVRVVIGTALYTSNFVPSTSPLTAVANTKLLTLQNATIVDNSTNALTFTNTGSVVTSAATPFTNPTIGSDASGNINNWIPNNINVSTPGVTYDSMTDVPTLTSATAANYAVLNPIFTPPSTTISNGNLQATKTANVDVMVASSIAPSSGKFYCELTLGLVLSASNIVVGLVKAGSKFTGSYDSSNAVTFSGSTNVSRYGTALGAVGTSFATNDVVGIAYDADNLQVTLYKNNTSIYTVSSLASEAHYFFWDGYQNTEYVNFNFGQRPFTYTPPTGFVALNTQNLPDSTIKNGATVMAATTYTGNGGSLSIANTANGVSMQPDFVWIKSRSNAQSNGLYDSVRGIYKWLRSDGTDAEQTFTDSVQSFNSNGFSISSYAGLNTNAATYVGWQWQAGKGSTSSNTSGSITSTVSVNATAGFSIVTYTGNQTAGATVGHGLGVAPNLIIVKSRGAVTSWPVYHSALGATNWIMLNSTSAQQTTAQEWNNTAPTSTVFSIGNSSANSNQAATYVAYCWSAVKGFSAFGSYTGNGSTDGPFVYTGFRPRFIMFKRTDAAASWRIMDTSREPINATQTEIYPNSSSAEASAPNGMDILSNGFKLRGSYSEWNTSGGTFMYAAFAENPLKYALAR